MFSISHILQRIWCSINVYRFWYGSSSTHRVWRLNLWTTMLLVDFASDKPICNIYTIKWEGTKKSQSLIKDRHYVLFPRRKMSPTNWVHRTGNHQLYHFIYDSISLKWRFIFYSKHRAVPSGAKICLAIFIIKNERLIYHLSQLCTLPQWVGESGSWRHALFYKITDQSRAMQRSNCGM